MNINKVEYFLGIDGGGTKTEFLLTDTAGNAVKRIILGASNPVNIGIENTKALLAQGISQVCNGVDYGKISVFAGIAGCGAENNTASIRDFLSDFGFAAFGSGSDADNAVSAALKGENGVAVIMGTGIIAFGILDGKTHRAGGRGYMIDKGGSGFCFGSDALNSAFEFVDGRGGSELMLKLIEEKLENPLTASLSRIYDGGAAYVASFAPIVFEAYKQGDKAAEAIIDRNAYEAAKIIRAACGSSDIKRENIVILGGLCMQKDILEPFIAKHLGNEYSFRFFDEPTVNGAVYIAKSILR